MKILTILFTCMMMLSCETTAKSDLVELSTNYGSIIIELNSAAAPNTVKNFLNYVDEGHYDGTIFHRVINGFMIQGGGFDENMTKRKTKKPIMNESNNGLSNVVGTIAMARTSDPHSATSQFYINVANNTFLNHQSEQQPGYCVFGRVIEGIGVVQKIKAVPVSNFDQYQNVPNDPVKINRARRVTAEQLAKDQNISLPKSSKPPLPSMTD
jgi:peptidyl-prolyl cis-trans isomerase B (cyclophilin B)